MTRPSPGQVRLSPGDLGTAQVEIPKLLTDTYSQMKVRTGRPEGKRILKLIVSLIYGPILTHCL